MKAISWRDPLTETTPAGYVTNVYTHRSIHTHCFSDGEADCVDVRCFFQFPPCFILVQTHNHVIIQKIGKLNAIWEGKMWSNTKSSPHND